jgi:hypothetical protein
MLFYNYIVLNIFETLQLILLYRHAVLIETIEQLHFQAKETKEQLHFQAKETRTTTF